MRSLYRLPVILAASLTIAAGLVRAETTLEFWQFWTDPDVKPVVTQIVNDFEQVNPDIKVNVTDLTWANGHEKIVVAFASGTGPDVVELGSDWIAQFASSDQIADIGDNIANDSSAFQGWSMATYKDKVYARPWILGTRVLFVNVELSERIGADSGVVPANWGQLESACKKMSELGDDIYGWGSNTAEKHRLYKKFLPFFWSNGAQIFTDDGRLCVLSSQAGIDALKYYKKLHDEHGYVANQRGIEDAFLDNKVGYILSGDWLLRRIKKEKRNVRIVTSFVPGPNLPGRSFMGGEFLALNAKSEHEDAALKFMQFVTAPENQVKLCKAGYMANPSSIAAQQDSFFVSDINLQTFIKQLRFSKHPPVDPNWVDIESAIEEAVEQAVFGKDSLIAQPLYEASQKIQKIIDR